MRLTVMPVALRPEGDDPGSPMAVSVLRSTSGLITEMVEDIAAVVPQAESMLAAALPSEVDDDPDLRGRNRRLENIGVDYSSGVPNLLFSAVLPIAATELNGEPDRWTRLVMREADDAARVTAPETRALVRYWRDQLLRTTAAFDFLPEYFPLSQVRAIYSSVWGEEQQDANFQRWMLSAKDVESAPVLAEVASEVVQRSAQAAFVERVARVLGAVPSSIQSNWDPKYVGVSAGVAALGGGMKAIPAAVVAGAIVGSLVGWQRARGAGRPPAWFRRTNVQRVELLTWYPVRPPIGSHHDVGSEV